MGISENIKILRERYHLTQDDLAEIAGVTNKAVSTWELGSKDPRMGAIEKIASHFGIKKSNLIEDGGMDRIHESKNHGFAMDLTDIEVFTIAAQRIGHKGPLTEREFEKIKLAFKIVLSDN